MPKEPLKDRLKKLTELKERFLRDANIEAGRIDGQIRLLEELIKEEEGGTGTPEPGADAKAEGSPS